MLITGLHRNSAKFHKFCCSVTFSSCILRQNMIWHAETPIDPWLCINLNHYLHCSHIGSLLKMKKRSTFDPHFIPPLLATSFIPPFCSSSSWWTCSPQTRRQPQSVSVLRPSPARPSGGFLPGRAGTRRILLQPAQEKEKRTVTRYEWNQICLTCLAAMAALHAARECHDWASGMQLLTVHLTDLLDHQCLKWIWWRGILLPWGWGENPSGCTSDFSDLRNNHVNVFCFFFSVRFSIRLVLQAEAGTSVPFSYSKVPVSFQIFAEQTERIARSLQSLSHMSKLTFSLRFKGLWALTHCPPLC